MSINNINKSYQLRLTHENNVFNLMSDLPEEIFKENIKFDLNGDNHIINLNFIDPINLNFECEIYDENNNLMHNKQNLTFNIAKNSKVLYLGIKYKFYEELIINGDISNLYLGNCGIDYYSVLVNTNNLPIIKIDEAAIHILTYGVEKGWNPHTIISNLVLRWITPTLKLSESFREPEGNLSSCYSSIVSE